MKHLAVALVLIAGCSKDKPAKAPEETQGTPVPVELPAKPMLEPSTGMLWVEEDYDKALALAKERQLPLVIDSWAPWCHTCMHMDKNVLTEAALGSVASEFVWLRLDRERPEHAPLIVKFPIAVSPTYYIINSDEEILARLLGRAGVPEFREFLANASATQASQQGPLDAASELLVAGTRAAVAGKAEEAKSLFEEARQTASKDWKRLPELLHNQINLLRSQGDFAACASLAIEALPLSTHAPASLGVMAFEAEMCARESDRKKAAQVRKAIVGAVDIALASDVGGLGERSEAMQIRRHALLALGREDEALAAARVEINLLNTAARAAATPRDAMPYQIAAAEAYVFVGDDAEFLPVLEKAVADLPLEYHLKFILAQLYFLDGRYQDALQQAERARELSYGPQQGSILAFIPEVYLALEQPEEEAAARKDLVRFYEGLPEGHRRAAELEAAKQALAGIASR